MTDSQRNDLSEKGYCFLEGYLSQQWLTALRGRIEELFALEGERAGSEFRQEEGARRLANLVDKGEIFEQAIIAPEMLEGVEAVLGPRFKLSSLNARSANPRSGMDQPLHVDMGCLPDEHGYSVCNCIWMLDDFTAENGATRAIPGSHRWRSRPQEVLPDPAAPHPAEELIMGKAGTIVIMNAHTWHGGTANRTDRPRLAMHSFYVRYDLPQQQYQKRLLRPEIQARLSPQLRAILALDDPLNDALSSQGSGRSGFLK